MPSKTEDYEVMLTIGCGSYGNCQKVKRKSDGKVNKVQTELYRMSSFVFFFSSVLLRHVKLIKVRK